MIKNERFRRYVLGDAEEVKALEAYAAAAGADAGASSDAARRDDVAVLHA